MEKVNIDQWFEHMRNQELPDSEKRQIYSRIDGQVNRVLFINKFRRYAKAGSFVAAIAVAALLFFAAYSPTSPSELMVIDTSNPAVTTIKPIANTSIVTASTVGQLIKVEGDIGVYKEEEKIETQNLDSGDVVLLKENARVELTVRQGVKATITGPAKFTIEHVVVNPTQDVYMLNLLEGEYVEVKALPQKTEGEKVDTVVVKTSTIEIQQLPATRNLNITISTQNGVPTVENGGDDVIVKTIDEDQEGAITVLARNETYTVDTAAQLTQETAEQYTQELEDETFAIRYEVEEEVKDDAEEKEEAPSKRVLDPDLLANLERSISSQYIDIHINNITLYADNEQAQLIALGNLTAAINKARSVMELAPIGPSLGDANRGVQGLQAHLQENYFVSPGLANRFYSISASIQALGQ